MKYKVMPVYDREQRVTGKGTLSSATVVDSCDKTRNGMRYLTTTQIRT